MPRRQHADDKAKDTAATISDLRQRKRVRTKLMVQEEAMRLFVQKGYENTTVEDIAHAATMSPRTFFRYFPTKEDVVLWDEYDELPVERLWQVPAGEDPWVNMVATIREMMLDFYRREPQQLLVRIRLAFAVPEIRARFLDNELTKTGPYLQQMAEALGVDQLSVACTIGALYAAMFVAVEHWQRHGGQDDLTELVDKTIALVATGAENLRVALATDAKATHANDAARD